MEARVQRLWNNGVLQAAGERKTVVGHLEVTVASSGVRVAHLRNWSGKTSNPYALPALFDPQLLTLSESRMRLRGWEKATTARDAMQVYFQEWIVDLPA